MANNLLVQGISILYDMELNNYLMTRNIQNLEEQKSKLAHYRVIDSPKKQENMYSYIDGLLDGGRIGGIVAGIFGLILGFTDEGGVIGKIFSALLMGVFLCIIGALIGGVIGFFVGIILKINEQKKINKKSAEDWQVYNGVLANERARVEREKQEILFLTHQQEIIRRKLNESKRLLETFYNRMGIDKSYRNIVPIGYMSQFIKLGISTKLEGVDGLYYLIRQELRADQLQYTLESISNKLDMIIDRQSEVYRELTRINRKCDDIVHTVVEQSKVMNKSLRSIEQNTRVTAYNSERIAKEASYQSFMMTYYMI